MFGDSNGQIKLRAKQKYKFLSATNMIGGEGDEIYSGLLVERQLLVLMLNMKSKKLRNEIGD